MFALEVHLSKFQPSTHPKIRNNTRGAGLHQGAREKQDGSHVDKRLGNGPVRQQ